MTFSESPIKDFMKISSIVIIGLIAFPNNKFLFSPNASSEHWEHDNIYSSSISDGPDSWQAFLQNLPTANKPIVDYRGRIVPNQEKHAAIITYDVGTSDLQQCADALIRLRAEFLYSNKRDNEIGFHFASGAYYPWRDYCKGVRPLANRRGVVFCQSLRACPMTHETLRKYLDIVFAYANTVSLCKELKAADKFAVGTVIIYPGYPGHCCIVIDEKVINNDTLFKLAEGFMPAQSIYILSNPFEPRINPWYHLHKGTLKTASYEFMTYFLRKFE